MGLFTPRQEQGDEEEGDGLSLSLPLDEQACPLCRRTLHPWEPTCPEHGLPAVPRTSLAALEPPPAHLLDDEDDPARDADDA